jgi:long-chain-alcohol oxidase
MTLSFPYTAGALVYVRDRGSGRVYLGADGLPRASYWLSDFDQQSMLKASARAGIATLKHWPL